MPHPPPHRHAPFPHPTFPPQPSSRSPHSLLSAVGSREQPLRVHQHGPAVQLAGSQQQRTLPRLAGPLAVGPVHEAAAGAVRRPGVLPGPRSEVLGAPGGPDGRGVVAGSNIICENRLWGQKIGVGGLPEIELGSGAWTRGRGL